MDIYIYIMYIYRYKLHKLCASCGDTAHSLGIGRPILHKYTQICQNIIKNYPKCKGLKKIVVFAFEEKKRKAPATATGGFFLKKWSPKGPHEAQGPGPNGAHNLLGHKAQGPGPNRAHRAQGSHGVHFLNLKTSL